MTSAPTIDILLATHNGEQFLAEQIESVRYQTYENWQLLISDDCSTDETLQIIRNYERIDHRIHLVSQAVRFGGAKENFMWLLSQSGSPYAMFCDQDDVWFPEKIDVELAFMHALEAEMGARTPLLVFSDMAVVDDEVNLSAPSFERYSNLKPTRNSFSRVLAQAIGAGCTFLMNHVLVELSTRCARVNDIIMHDWWVSVVASAFGSIDYVNAPLSLYRQHDSNSIGAIKFSIAAWWGKTKQMVDRQESVACQAGCFADTFARDASACITNAAYNCAASCSGTVARNVYSLFKSGAWKAGSRKAGQLVAVFERGRAKGFVSWER